MIRNVTSSINNQSRIFPRLGMNPTYRSDSQRSGPRPTRTKQKRVGSEAYALRIAKTMGRARPSI